MILQQHSGRRGRGSRRSWLILVGALLPALLLAQVPGAGEEGGEVVIPELTPVQSEQSIRELWADMRRAKNQRQYSVVCEKLDALRQLGQDIRPSAKLAGYAYLVCARQRVVAGDIDGTRAYLQLSIDYGGERPEHAEVRADINRQQGLDALKAGDLGRALSQLQKAYAGGKNQQQNEVVSAELTGYAFEMHGRGEDIKALAALDVALLFFPHNRQAELLRREIWMWDYGVWIVIAFVIFGVALYFVFRQWREIKIRESAIRDW